MRCRVFRSQALCQLAAAASLTFLVSGPAFGQLQAVPPAPPPEPPPPAEEPTRGPTVGDSRVGYIDSAPIGNEFRLRFDAAYNDRVPNRAEFFYAQGRPGGPGVPLSEPRIDYQELSAYLEVAVNERLSGFVEAPWRFLNPEVNANANGPGDLNAGFKFAFLSDPDRVATFQLRTYAPTGDAGRGLGNDHVSLEPALLVYQRIDARWAVESELRDWVPIGGTDFAGNVLRYGIGLHYDLYQRGCLRFVPIVEMIGWTVLGGKESMVLPLGVVAVEGAAGDTIVNAKLGFRLVLDGVGDFYMGYGRPLTGDRWYENTFRVEFRLLF
jgi:hypothetical protein